MLYAGRITREKGAELLADAFLAARERDPRLHLVLAGGGPEQERLRERVGEHATFLGWLEGDELARAYASADVFLFPSATDTFGQVILEAQASGLPVVAVAAGGPLTLVRDRVTGMLCEADAGQLCRRAGRARRLAAAARAPAQGCLERWCASAPGSGLWSALRTATSTHWRAPLDDRPKPIDWSHDRRGGSSGGMTCARRTIAVAIHDIEPATFERCALIRDWLDDHGVGKVTLLVIPARDLHPLAERSPEMVRWLIERERGGDAIAQHGFQHLRSTRSHGRAGGPYQALRAIGADRETEFVGLDANETRRAVDAGRRVLKLAGLEPRGFVAPGYAYTPALRQTLSERFHWWTALLGLQHARANTAGSGHDGDEPLAVTRVGVSRSRPPIALSSAGRCAARLPALLRAGALVSGATLRLDLYPSDLEHPSHILALEWVLKRSACREAVTYEELARARAARAPGRSVKTPHGAARSGGLPTLHSPGGVAFTATAVVELLSR